MKYRQTQAELEEHLEEQLSFLQSSALSFDNGFEAEAKRIAQTLRVLLHDTKKSTSLLSSLNRKSIKFYDTSIMESGVRLGPYEGILVKAIAEDGAKYVAPLDDVPKGTYGKYVEFEDYWTKTIIIDNQGNSFSRKDIVCNLSNKDGGAHIDPELNGKYADLSRRNSMGWEYVTSINKGTMTYPEKSAVRQIAHEVLRTLVPNYPMQKKLSDLNAVVVGSVLAMKKEELPMFQKVGRNEKCPCGSLKKYKKCHWPN